MKLKPKDRCPECANSQSRVMLEFAQHCSILAMEVAVDELGVEVEDAALIRDAILEFASNSAPLDFRDLPDFGMTEE